MANTYKNIIITPNIGNTADPKIQLLGGNTTANTDINLFVYPSSNGTVSFEGSAGQLFSITNDLSNSLFAVSDVSGIPSLEVFANGLVSAIPFGGNVVFGNSSVNVLVNSSAVVGNTVGTHTGAVVLGTSSLSANGGVGTAGQVLHSNGTATYWAADDNAGGTVTSVASGNGITGGTITGAGTLSAVAGTGTVVNSTGIHVNATYIATISANNASFLGGVAAASYVQNTESRTLSGNLNFTGSNTTVNAVFRVVNATANVLFAGANGNIGIGTNSPVVSLDVRGVLQSQAYDMPNTDGTAQWVKLGTFTAGQTGHSIRIRLNLHSGYNADNSQDSYVDIFFKTSNGSSVNGTGFAGNSFYSIRGFRAQDITPKWVSNAAGGAASSYDLYLFLPVYTLKSHYLVEISQGTTWTNLGTLSQTDPGVGSSTVLLSTAGYNITIGNVGIGNTTPAHKLRVTGTTSLAGAVSDITTLAAGNTTITGFVNATSSLAVGTAFTANATVVNAVSYYSGTLLVANTTVINATHLGGYTFAAPPVIGSSTANGASLTYANVSGQVNTATLYAATSANIASAVQANATGLWTTGTVNAAVVSSTNATFTRVTNVIQAAGDLRVNLGTPSVEENALFHAQMNNKFRFIAPTSQEQSTDGVTWTTSTRATAAQLGDLMIGEGQGTGFNAIPSGTIGTADYYRLTWNVHATTGYIFLNHLYIFAATQGNQVNFKIEALNNVTAVWDTIASGTSSGWPAHFTLKHSNIAYHNAVQAGFYAQVRVTFTVASRTNTNSVVLYAIEWFGGYPNARRNVESYDRLKNVTFPANVVAGTFIGNTVARNINGTAFNSSADITTANWGTARNINGTSVNGSANYAIGRIYDTNYRRFTNPGGGEFVTSTTTVTGAIQIVFPNVFSVGMYRLTVQIYEYVTNQSFTVVAAGHTSGTSWYNTSAYIIGNPSVDRRYTVRFGRNAANKAVVYIGELASTWSYPQVFLTEFQCGYAGYEDNSTGWAISFNTTAFENVTQSITNSQVGYAVSTNTVNSTVLRDGSGNFSAGTITASLSGSTSGTHTGAVVLGSSSLSANGGVGTAGQVLHSNGSATYWAADDNAGGTVTSVAGGTGLTGGTITTSGTLSVNAAYIATITANNATFMNGNNVLSVMESLRANRNITGGGTITVDASYNVLWTARFIVISNGRGAHFSTAGYFDIQCPTSGTITGVGGSANKTATAAGIPLGAWESLYYILPIGSGATSLAANFRVSGYTADVEIPSNWVLICARNTDGTHAVSFPNGINLLPGQSYNTTIFSSSVVPTANNSNNLNGKTEGNLNVNAAAQLVTTRSINGVNFNGTANILVPSIYDSNYRRIDNPGGAEYITTSSPVTGAIQITLPVGWTSTMMRMTIRIYEYASDSSFDVVCGGYNYGPTTTWINTFAYILGDKDVDRRYTVRFGFTAGGKCVIYIGELASTWSYPQVFVTDVQLGYGGQSATWVSGWAIGVQATAFEAVTSTVTSTQIGYGTSTSTADALVLRDASSNFAANNISTGNSTVNATYGQFGVSVQDTASINATYGADMLYMTDSTLGVTNIQPTSVVMTGLGATPNTGSFGPSTVAIGNSSIVAYMQPGTLSITNGLYNANLAATTLTMSLGGNITTVNATVINTASYYAGTLLVANTTVINATHLAGVATSGYARRGGGLGSIDYNAERARASGFYSVDAAPTNGPPGATYSNFIQMTERGDTSAQIVVDYATGQLHSRGIQTATPTYSAWRTYLSNTANLNISGGFTVTSYNAGTSPNPYTPSGLNGNYQYLTNNGAFQLNAPAADCAIDLLIINGATPGAVTFSGYQTGVTGGSLNTTANHEFIVSIRRINGFSTYSIYALQ